MTLDDDALTRRLQLGTLSAEPAPSTGTALDDLARADSPARTLLRQAALLTLARRAARLADPAPACPDPAPPDPRPLASAELTALCDYALRTPKLAAALPELLDRLAAHGLRLPHRLTPSLLSLAGAAPSPLRDLAEALAGPRGAWVRALLAPSPSGTSLDPEQRDPEQLSPSERLALVTRLRDSDDPVDLERARALVTELLPRERPDQRRALLMALASGLGPADQPLLEAALSDRAASVREGATLVLQGLPGSATAHRIRARLDAAITRNPQGAALTRDPQGAALVLRAPPMDDDWHRDGLALGAVTGLSPEVSRLVYLVRAAPPDTLASLLGLTPIELLSQLALLADPVLRGALLAGLAAAALRFRAASFAEPVWLAFARQPRSPTPIELLALVPRPRRQALIAWRVAKAESPDPATLPLLSALEGPWPHDLSRLIAAWVRHCRSPYELASGLLGPWLEIIATRLHPDELPALLERPQFFHGSMRSALLIAETRRRLHALLPPRPSTPDDEPILSATSLGSALS